MHLPFGFIHLVHNLRKDFQALLCHGIGCPAAGISDGEERGSTPRVGYLGEEPVFDGVELGAVWRVVHDENPYAYAVGKVHEVLLEDTVSAGVGAAAVAEDDNHFGMRVEPFQMAVPYTLYVLAHELGSVVAVPIERYPVLCAKSYMPCGTIVPLEKVPKSWSRALGEDVQYTRPSRLKLPTISFFLIT